MTFSVGWLLLHLRIIDLKVKFTLFLILKNKSHLCMYRKAFDQLSVQLMKVT